MLNVGVVGLGLIGGSIGSAYMDKGYFVYGLDKDKNTQEIAILKENIKYKLTKENIGDMDLIFICLYPRDTINFIKDNAAIIKKGALVIDTSGIKREICEVGFKIASQNGFLFVGGHPMAGTQYSGIKYARKTLFKDSSFIVVPPSYDDIELLDRIKCSLSPLLIGKITVSTAYSHDKNIAFTSQMAHIVSNAFIKSPTAQQHKGFSAGSYKDLTRVAWLNATMWTQIFMDNKDFLIEEIDILEKNLEKYKKALIEKDEDKLFELLDEGKKIKEEVDNYHR